MKSSEVYTPATAAFIAGSQPVPLNETDIDQCSCNDGAEASEDEWLVQGCIQGDQRAWEELIDKYKRLIFLDPAQVWRYHRLMPRMFFSPCASKCCTASRN